MRLFLTLFILLAPYNDVNEAQQNDVNDATVEVIVEDYEEEAIVRKFLVLEDGKKIRIKGVNELKTGDKVKVNKGRLKKLEKATNNSVTTEAEVEASEIKVDKVLQDEVILKEPIVYDVDVVLVSWGGTRFQTRANVQNYYDTVVTPKFLSMSYGTFTYKAVVHDWVLINPPPTDMCNYPSVMSAADAELLKQGTSVTFNMHRQYIMQSYPKCGFSGVGIVGGLWTVLHGGTYSSIHEFGHNRGLMHSSFYSCQASGCRRNEYGDSTDYMGSSGTGQQFNPRQKSLAKPLMPWLVSEVVTKPGDYKLDSYTGLTGRRAIRLLKTTAQYSEDIYVAVSSGQVRVWYDTSLQDMDPVTSAEVKQLSVGKTHVIRPCITCPADGRTITTVSLTGDTAVVRIGTTDELTPGKSTITSVTLKAPGKSAIIGVSKQ